MMLIVYRNFIFLSEDNYRYRERNIENFVIFEVLHHLTTKRRKEVIGIH